MRNDSYTPSHMITPIYGRQNISPSKISGDALADVEITKAMVQKDGQISNYLRQSNDLMAGTQVPGLSQDTGLTSPSQEATSKRTSQGTFYAHAGSLASTN